LIHFPAKASWIHAFRIGQDQGDQGFKVVDFCKKATIIVLKCSMATAYAGINIALFVYKNLVFKSCI